RSCAFWPGGSRGAPTSPPRPPASSTSRPAAPSGWRSRRKRFARSGSGCVLGCPAVKAFAACALLLAALPTGCGRRKETASPPAAASAPAAEADCTARTRRPADARHPVLWLGLDGLDFEILDRLAAAGKMPTWKRITSEGYTAKLASFVPLISPILWTTAATGVAPDVHRVLDFQ